MKISIAVVDESLRQRNMTVMMVDEYIRKRHIDARIEGFRSGPELLITVDERGQFDIYILETSMPDMNGIVLARELRARFGRGRIVYYTRDASYAVQAFEVKADNYILKPSAPEKFSAMLDDVLELIETEGWSRVIELRVRNGYVRVSSDDVTYVNIVGRTLCYHLRDGSSIRTIALRVPFRIAVEELLEHPSFFIAGASMLINLSYVRVVGRDAVLLDHGERITPPKSSYAALYKAWKMHKTV